MDGLEQKEFQRYARHFNLPDFDTEQQLKLKKAKVLVVGAGGLGSPVLLYLAAAGIGTIGIIDPDVVSLSNLQRQVLYTTDQIGLPKTEMASQRLSALNPLITIKTYQEALTTSNALEIISQYDIVADGTDNFASRYLINDACVICNKPNVYASIYQYEGQISVFNFINKDGSRGPHYRDLYPEPPAPGLVPDCATGGVLGVLAGIVGTMQALEVIKLAAGIGTSLAGRLLLFDAHSFESRIIHLQKKSEVQVAELINYEDFCGVNQINTNNTDHMKEITVQELKKWRDEGKDFQLVDVREQNERDFVNIGGDHIPMGDLMDKREEISEDKDVVMMCRSGARSAAALMALEQQGLTNLYNLRGGIVAWATEIDTTLPTY